MDSLRIVGASISMLAADALESAQQQAREVTSRVQNEVVSGVDKVRQQAAGVGNLDITKVPRETRLNSSHAHADSRFLPITARAWSWN